MYDYDSEDFKETYDVLIEACNHLFDEEVDSLMIAAVCTTIGLSIYRSLLDEKDFDRVIEAMSHFKDDWDTADRSDFKELGTRDHKGYLN